MNEHPPQSPRSTPHLHLVPPLEGAGGRGGRASPPSAGRVPRDDWSLGRLRSGLAVTHQDRGSLWILTLAGEADVATRDVLVRGLHEALSEEREVLVVDVSTLEFCDSRCATVVIEANCNAPQTQVILVGGRGMVSRVFDLLDPAGTLPRHPGARGLGAPGEGAGRSTPGGRERTRSGWPAG